MGRTQLLHSVISLSQKLGHCCITGAFSCVEQHRAGWSALCGPVRIGSVLANVQEQRSYQSSSVRKISPLVVRQHRAASHAIQRSHGGHVACSALHRIAGQRIETCKQASEQ